MEVWRPIEEAPRYEVSNLGDVRNKHTKRILRTSDNGKGIARVQLRDAGFSITRSVESLRKRAFG